MTIADSKLIKNINRTIIIQEIIKNEPISRSNLAKITGLNKVTISSQISDLLDEKLLIEEKAENSPSSSGGKKPILLFINKKCAYSLGLEFRKNCIFSVLTNLSGEIIYKDKFPIKKTSTDIILNEIKNIFDFYNKKIKVSQYGIVGISIGIHGKINNNDDIILTCDKLMWKNVPLKKLLVDIFPNLSINIKNNNYFSVLAEKSFYNILEDSFIFLNMSAGIGSGIVIDNKILSGVNGLSSEVGHISIELNGRRCYCGRKGCWERYACEEAFLKDLSKLKNKTITFEKFEKLLTNNDKETIVLLKNYEEYIYSGLLSIINIFDPKLILIHNRIISAYPDLIKNLRKKVLKHNKIETDVKLSELEDISCCLGAAISNILDFLHIKSLKLNSFIK